VEPVSTSATSELEHSPRDGSCDIAAPAGSVRHTIRRFVSLVAQNGDVTRKVRPSERISVYIHTDLLCNFMEAKESNSVTEKVNLI
jgi:hypothetical protein